MTTTDQGKVARRVRRGAIEILRKVRSGEIIPAEVSTGERRLCVAYLRLEGYTQEETAEIFRVSRHTIGRDEKAIREQTARLVDEIDVRAVAGGLIAWARHITARALKEKDYALAWKVQREVIADLQGLGYLPKVAQQHDVRIQTFVDLARAAGEEEFVDGVIEAGAPPALSEGTVAEAAVEEAAESDAEGTEGGDD